MSRVLRVVLMALLSVLLVAPGGPASAHDELIGSDPEDGAALGTAPEQVTLTFSGQISELGAQVVLEDAAGGSLTEGEPRVEGTEVVQDMADLDAGSYTLLWRVTSADGHPISGDLSFTVTASAEPEETAEPTTAEATTAAAEETTTAAETGDAPTDEATPTPGTTVEEVEDGGDGAPVWVWVVVGVAVLGVLALLARTWTRGRD